MSTCLIREHDDERQLMNSNHFNHSGKNCLPLSTLTVLLVLILNTLTCSRAIVDYAAHVNPFIGTGETGNCYPGAQAPFGMISLSPNTSFEDYDNWYARPGYKYDREEIVSFTTTHISGVGCHAMQDLPFMPSVGQLDRSPVKNREAYMSKFSHQHESARPGQYQVSLLSTGIEVDMCTSTRAGIVSLDYPQTRNAHVLFTPTHSANGVADSELNIDFKTREISGWVRTGGFCWRDPSLYPYVLYFTARFNRPFKSYGVWDASNKSIGKTVVSGDSTAAFLSFDCQGSSQVLMKIAISYVSVDNARLNLTEIKGWDHAKVKRRITKLWNEHLGKIHIDGSEQQEKTIFYTALYHNMLQPSIFEDMNGEYIGFDDQVHTVDEGHHHYANFSLWDTYRTTAQLQTLLFPDRASDMVMSLIRNSDQAQGGGLPIWTIANTDNGCMNGYSAAPFIANMLAFGATDIDLEAVKDKLVQTGRSYHRIKDSRGWEGLEEYKRLGYVPYESFPEECVSMTVEYSIDDFSIAEVCRLAGDSLNYSYFLKRSKNVFNLFNSNSRFLQPRHRDGNWVADFDSCSSAGFAEGNSNHYTWNIPHHIEELIERCGGSAIAEKRLDRLMSKILIRGWPVHEPYYWLGNEPCFGIPFTYNWLDERGKTSKTLDRVLMNFRDDHEGLVGDDDVGALSALYVFSAAGLYPVKPGIGGFTVVSPRFEKMRWFLGNGMDLKIIQNDKRFFPGSQLGVKVNGEMLHGHWLQLKPLLEGDTIVEFELKRSGQ